MLLIFRAVCTQKDWVPGIHPWAYALNVGSMLCTVYAHQLSASEFYRLLAAGLGDAPVLSVRTQTPEPPAPALIAQST